MVCLRNMCMATLNKGDNDSHNNNNNVFLHYCQLLEHNYSIIQYMAQPFHKILGTSSQSVVLNGKINNYITVP